LADISSINCKNETRFFGLVLLLSLDVSPTEQVATEEPLESWLKLIVSYLAAGAEIAAAIVIGGAVFRGIGLYLRQLFSRSPLALPGGQSRQQLDSTESIRLQLGRVLTLGLEFTVASDILRTAVAPTRQDIINLGEIVLLRTLLNYFLEREIQQVEQNRATQREMK
jgi:uncharacterized membrane protein